MATDAQVRGWTGPSRRRARRLALQAPVDVVQAQVLDKMPGHSVNISERGIAVVLAGELAQGEAVGVELRWPHPVHSLRARAVVRHQTGLDFGLEFLELSPEQRTTIREWIRNGYAEGTNGEFTQAPILKLTEGKIAESQVSRKRVQPVVDNVAAVSRPRSTSPSAAWVLALAIAVVLAMVFWWKWNRGWEELESGLKNQNAVKIEQPQLNLPAEEMEKMLVHRVEPAYPDAARQQGLEGVIVLDMIVGSDGSVESMRPLNGPDVLAGSAMDALRWWKFRPYRVDGKAVAVETRMAVEFKP